MAHLSPKKGGYPFKDQHDRTCMVSSDDSSKEIERGSIICVNTDGEFELAADTSVKPLYIALQNYSDLQANMAGFFSVGKGVAVSGSTGAHQGEAAHLAASVNAPAITGIHMDDGDVWQTDMFDEDATYTIGAQLTVKDGLVTTDGASDDNCVGYVTAVPYTRYANDAVAVTGLMTGAHIRVLDYQCGK